MVGGREGITWVSLHTKHRHMGKERAAMSIPRDRLPPLFALRPNSTLLLLSTKWLLFVPLRSGAAAADAVTDRLSVDAYSHNSTRKQMRNKLEQPSVSWFRWSWLNQPPHQLLHFTTALFLPCFFFLSSINWINRRRRRIKTKERNNHKTRETIRKPNNNNRRFVLF